MIQWIGIGIVAVLGLAAALLLTDGSGTTHLNAPPLAEVSSTI
ncbi:MAG: hypothetical protein AAFO29_02510 [Actinomycetota bacterium]